MSFIPLPAFPLTVYFDGSCRLCSAEINNLKARDAEGRLTLVDCSPLDFTGGPAPRAALMDAIHAVDANDQVFVGVDTFRAIYAAAGLPWVSTILGLPLVSRLAQLGYPLLVRNRYRLPDRLVSALFDRAARQAVRRGAGCRNGVCDLGTTSGER